MTERELLTKFLDYIYHIQDKSTQYTAIGPFLEEGKHQLNAWTTDYPTKPGYYWLRNYVIKYGEHPAGPLVPGPELVNIDDSYPDACEYIFWIGDEVGVRSRHILSAEWYGPIQPPESI